MFKNKHKQFIWPDDVYLTNTESFG